MWRFHRYFCRFKGRNTWFSALWKVFRVRHHSNLLYFACHLCSTVMYLYSMNILLRVTLVIVQIFVTFQLNNYRIAHTPIIKSAFQPLVKMAQNFWNFWKIFLAQYQRKTSVQAPGVDDNGFWSQFLGSMNRNGVVYCFKASRVITWRVSIDQK